MALKEDYLDDILDTSVNEKRKYRMINNADGTISLEDVTEYSQNGDNFGSFDINITNKTVNELIAMGLNVRCNSEGYLEVLVDSVWKESNLQVLSENNYLYQNGTNYAEFTSFKGGPSANITETSYLDYNILYVVEDENLTVRFVGASGNAALGMGSAMSKSYDLTNYNKLVFGYECSAFKEDSFTCIKVFITPNKQTKMESVAEVTLLSSSETTSNGKIELDISSITGTHYIGIYLQTNINDSGNVSVTLINPYLE